MAKTLLLVENETVIVAMVEKFFSGRGFVVTVARNYADYSSNRHQRFDAAIVDCSLEGALNRDGLRIVRELKTQSLLTFVVLFTAIQDPGLFAEAKAAGADEVLTKPASLTKLDTLISQRIKNQ